MPRVFRHSMQGRRVKKPGQQTAEDHVTLNHTPSPACRSNGMDSDSPSVLQVLHAHSLARAASHRDGVEPEGLVERGIVG